jgi:phage terminase large subunit
LHTSYLDIPAEWLGNDFILEAERLREINEQAYRHEYLGEATGSGGEVFPNIEVREITDDEIAQQQYIYAGVDFGFSVDPAVFIRVAFDRKHDTVFLLDEIYKQRMSNRQLAEAIKEKGYQYTGQTVNISMLYGLYEPCSERQVIICDSADPKSISDLQGEGLKTIACKKYPGSVLYGIKWLQNRRIVIDPARTPHAHKEFISYEYMTTKDGEFLADVPDANNHTIDAVRYALDRQINAKQYSA